jgi:chromosome segregation ATPase
VNSTVDELISHSNALSCLILNVEKLIQEDTTLDDRVNENRDLLDSLLRQIQAQRHLLQTYETAKSDLTASIAAHHTTMTTLSPQVDALQMKNSSLEIQLAYLSEMFQQNTHRCHSFQQQIDAREKRIGTLDSAVLKREQYLNELDDVASRKQKELNTKCEEIISSLQRGIEKREKRREVLDSMCSAREKRVDAFDQRLADLETQLQSVTNAVVKQEDNLQKTKAELIVKTNETSTITSELACLQRKVDSLSLSIEQKDAELAELESLLPTQQNQLDTLEEMVQSSSEKLESAEATLCSKLSQVSLLDEDLSAKSITLDASPPPSSLNRFSFHQNLIIGYIFFSRNGSRNLFPEVKAFFYRFILQNKSIRSGQSNLSIRYRHH